MSTDIRPMAPANKATLVGITARTGYFSEEEVATADEVLTECACKGDASGYFTQVAWEDGEPVGYVTYGPVPLTAASYDIYWIAVDPTRQGRGTGKALMVAAQAAIWAAGGRLMLAETSSRDQYAPTHRFYRSAGFEVLSRIDDFYDEGDALLVFGKRLGGTQPMVP
ncbi:MAG: GNAT family N-acetyltransferase [Chloroflexota bacterium]